MLVNKNSSNEQLMNDETTRTALDAGHVIIIDKQVTSNPEYTTLFLAGMVETASSSTASMAQASLLGWNDTNVYPIRCVQNSKTEIADKLPIGKVFTDFAMQIVDTEAPAYEGHTPRQSKDGDVYLSENGKSIYRSARLVTKDELAVEGHKTIKRATVVKPQVSAKVADMLAGA